MDRLSELVNLTSFGEFNKVRDTWYVLGSFEVGNNTKAYIKDTIVKINTGSSKGLDGCLIYVKENYTTGGDRPLINWDELEVDGTDNLTVTVNGISCPAFYVLLNKDEFDSIEEEIDDSYEPFEKENKSQGFAEAQTDIIISDTDLDLVMSEIGMPFFGWDEVEYSRETVCNLCVLPALRRYYREKPIIKRESKGYYQACEQVRFELPKYCTGIRRAEFRQGGNYGAGGFTGVMSFMNEQYALGGLQQGRFGRGVRYNKPVPGYTGVGAAGSTQSLAMMQRSIQQTISNHYKRVRFDVELDEQTGKRYATGYTTVGGHLDIEFKYWSPNFNLVRFDDLEIVIKHAQSYALRNFGALRNLVKTDIPGSLDVSGFNSRAQALEDEVKEYYKSHSKIIALRGEA